MRLLFLLEEIPASRNHKQQNNKSDNLRLTITHHSNSFFSQKATEVRHFVWQGKNMFQLSQTPDISAEFTLFPFKKIASTNQPLGKSANYYSIRVSLILFNSIDFYVAQ